MARLTVSATSSDPSPNAFSKSADTGSSVAATIVAACDSASSLVTDPSRRPRVAACPLLVVASASNPSDASSLAAPASHALGISNGASRWCNSRKCWAFSAWAGIAFNLQRSCRTLPAGKVNVTTVRGRTAQARRTGAVGLLEREPELAGLRDAIDEACSGTGRVVLLEGPAGIGKTALLRAARDMSVQADMRLLRARASDVEQEFEFGVVRQLFEGPLAHTDAAERESLYQGAAELASPLFGPSAGDGRSAPDLSFTLVHGLYWLTANLAETGPVMIAVDDAHWADPSSLRFLSYLGARCEELPVLVVATVRAGELTAAQELLSSLRGDPRTTVIEPHSLSEEAVTTLIRQALGERADPRFCSACAQASAGNPFLLQELLAELEAERVEPVAASAARVEGVRPDSVSR